MKVIIVAFGFISLFGLLGITDMGKESPSSSFPLVIAHRGARSLAPENTLAACRAAREVGADGWECDVHMTKDGELVLMHDNTLSRTTDACAVFPGRAPWLVSDFTLEEIRQLDAGSWFVRQDPFGTIASGELPLAVVQRFIGERVPTLRDALVASKEAGLWVDVELKGRPSFFLSPQAKRVVELTVKLVRELAMVEQVLISSFDPTMIQYLKEIAPEIPGAVVVNSFPVDPVGFLRGIGADALNPKFSHYEAQKARELRQEGFAVYVWTVNDWEELTKAASDPCITGIITDWPQRLLEILKSG